MARCVACTRVLNSEDAKEGIQSFIERRAAVFRGR